MRTIIIILPVIFLKKRHIIDLKTLVASFENSMDLVSDVRGRDFFFLWGLDVPNNGPFEFDPHVNNNQNDNNSDDSVNRDVYQPRLNLVTIFFSQPSTVSNPKCSNVFSVFFSFPGFTFYVIKKKYWAPKMRVRPLAPWHYLLNTYLSQPLFYFI